MDKKQETHSEEGHSDQNPGQAQPDAGQSVPHTPAEEKEKESDARQLKPG